MVDICNNYATRYDVKFNAKKSSLIIVKCDSSVPPDPQIVINSEKVRIVRQIVHLGHLLTDRIYDFDTSKCITDFNRQCNMFFVHFKNALLYYKFLV